MKHSLKTKSRLRHRMISGAVGVALVSGGVLVPTTIAHADQNSRKDYDLNYSIKSVPELASFSSVDMDNVAAVPVQSVVANTEDLKVTDTKVIAHNISFLKNDSDQEQTLFSGFIDVSHMDMVSSSATQGFGTSFEQSIKAKVAVPFLAEAEASSSLTLSFDASWTQSTTRSETKTYSLPAQPVKVPAHKRLKVESGLQTVNFSGKLRPVIDLSGNVELKRECEGKTAVPIGQLEAMLRDDGSVLHPENIVPNGDNARFIGEIDFSADIGTVLFVHISDADPTPTPSNAGNDLPLGVGGKESDLLVNATSQEPVVTSKEGMDVVSKDSAEGRIEQATPPTVSVQEPTPRYLSDLRYQAPCPGGEFSSLDKRYSSDGWQYGEFQLWASKNEDGHLKYKLSINKLEYLWGGLWYENRYPARVEYKLFLDGVEVRSLSSENVLSGVDISAGIVSSPGKHRISAEVSVHGMYWKTPGSDLFPDRINVDI